MDPSDATKSMITTGNEHATNMAAIAIYFQKLEHPSIALAPTSFLLLASKSKVSISSFVNRIANSIFFMGIVPAQEDYCLRLSFISFLHYFLQYGISCL